MKLDKQQSFVQKNRARKRYAQGGVVRMAGGGALGQAASGAAAGAAAGSIIPGIGTVIGGAVGAIGGFLSSIFGGGPSQPNIVDPVTGQQITDANGRVVASQQALSDYASTLQGQNGAQTQTAAIQALGNTYQGTGPNPAKAMLAEATGQNVANQSALMAGQRGAASNVGLIAREAAQQGANTQQQAVGQNAVVQSNQSLNALGQIGGLAGQQVAETQNALNSAGTVATNNQSNLLGAQTGYNAQVAGVQSNINTTNAALTNAAYQPVAQTAGSFLSGAAAQQGSTSGGVPGVSEDERYAKGGRVYPGPHKSHVANYLMAKGGKAKSVDAMVSPGEIYLTPDHVKQVQHGANPLKIGHKIPGKAKVKGNSLKNDTKPAVLEEGGVVLDRKTVNSMSPDKARLFVLKSLAERKAKHG